MYKVVIAGCGLIAAKKHIPAFLALRNKVEVAAVCDLNINAAKKTADSFNIRRTYADFSDMLLKEKPDIVDICTPPQTHARLGIEAIEKGAHIFLEKPMALKVSDCDVMIEAASKFRRQVCVVHNQVFNPAFIRAREYFLKGGIGDFLGLHIFLSTPTNYITSKKDHWAHALPGGILGESGPHGVYLAQAFLKDIYEVEVNARKIIPEYPWSNFEDFRIVLRAKNGIGTVELNYASNQWAAALDIMGTKGMLKIDLQSQTFVSYERGKLDAFTVGLSEVKMAAGKMCASGVNGIRYMLGKKSDGHYNGIREFTESIIENRPPLVTVGDGRETVRVMEMLTERLNCRKQRD